MLSRHVCRLSAARQVALLVIGVGILTAIASPVHAQGTGVFTAAVGGVSIDPQGALNNATVDALGRLSRFYQQSLQQIPGELNAPIGLRKVSLRGLDRAIQRELAGGRPLTDAMKYLAGLQHIQYVFVYPEAKDIVLVGPADGWKVDVRGNIVGVHNGQPVMLLDDLIVALRSAREAQGGITCSIDPTQEGLARLQSLTLGRDPEPAKAAIQEALGPQTITVQGVPATTHFARVLVAADYRMKRIAMKFEPAPVHGLPSYLDMAPVARRIVTPRWWLTPDYQPVVRDASGLAWKLGDTSVKTMTEEEFVSSAGARSAAARPPRQRSAGPTS